MYRASGTNRPRFESLDGPEIRPRRPVARHIPTLTISLVSIVCELIKIHVLIEGPRAAHILHGQEGAGLMLVPGPLWDWGWGRVALWIQWNRLFDIRIMLTYCRHFHNRMPTSCCI